MNTDSPRHSRYHEELSSEHPDPLIRNLHRVIKVMVRVLAVLMVALIGWGVVDVMFVFYSLLIDPPVMLITVSDIFQLFGAFLVVLIAVEIFINIRMYLGTNEIPVQLVIATALMAVARKVIVLDMAALQTAELLGLGVLAMALGVTYWLLSRKADEVLPVSTTGELRD